MLLGYTLARLARKIPTGAGSRSTPQPPLQVLVKRSSGFMDRACVALTLDVLDVLGRPEAL